MLHFKLVCTEKKSVESEELSEADILNLVRILYTNERNIRLGKLFIRLYEQLPDASDELKKILP
jgi:hypothetical protein